SGPRSLRRTKTTRATEGDAGKFRPAFGVDRGDRSEKLEPGRFAQGTEPGAEHGRRRAGRIRSATQPFAGDRRYRRGRSVARNRNRYIRGTRLAFTLDGNWNDLQVARVCFGIYHG